MFRWPFKKHNNHHTPLNEHELMQIEIGSEVTIELFEEKLGTTLDFSPQSLHLIDKYALDFHTDGTELDEIKLLIYSLGCYVGETMVKNLNGQWVHPSPEYARHIASKEAVLLPNGAIWNPIDKTKKLLINGVEDSVSVMYMQAAR